MEEFYDTLKISAVSHPTISKKIVVNDSKAFPGVVAPVSPAHQVLNNQANVNQSDFIIWRQMAL